MKKCCTVTINKLQGQDGGVQQERRDQREKQAAVHGLQGGRHEGGQFHRRRATVCQAHQKKSMIKGISNNNNYAKL